MKPWFYGTFSFCSCDLLRLQKEKLANIFQQQATITLIFKFCHSKIFDYFSNIPQRGPLQESSAISHSAQLKCSFTLVYNMYTRKLHICSLPGTIWKTEYMKFMEVFAWEEMEKNSYLHYIKSLSLQFNKDYKKDLRKHSQ